jgi:hypothetical protein
MLGGAFLLLALFPTSPWFAGAIGSVPIFDA